MASQSTVIAYAPLQSVDSTTFTGSFLPLGGPVEVSSRIFKIVNTSNVLVTVSTDGINAIDVLPANSFVLYDLGTNRGNPGSDLCLQAGSQFYVSGSAGTGLVYLVTLFAKGQTQTVPF